MRISRFWQSSTNSGNPDASRSQSDRPTALGQ